VLFFYPEQTIRASALDQAGHYLRWPAFGFEAAELFVMSSGQANSRLEEGLPRELQSLPETMSFERTGGSK